MAITNFIKNQFLDVIEYEDESGKILVHKYTNRASNEIKHGARVIVREGQYAVFIKGGKIADIFPPGTHRLDTDNLPILSALEAIPFLLNSPIKSDLYFISTKQSIDNKWATKNPIMMRDVDFGVMRLRSFGLFSFKISNVSSFMIEVFGSQKKVTTWDVVQYLISLLNESFSEVIAKLSIPALDLAANYRNIGNQLLNTVNVECQNLGIEFTNINIENISLPEEVERQIDEHSGMNLASKNINDYAQYQAIQAMRDAATTDGSLVGIGAGISLANQMTENLHNTQRIEKDPIEEILKYKQLLDAGAINQQEFDILKSRILGLTSE